MHKYFTLNASYNILNRIFVSDIKEIEDRRHLGIKKKRAFFVLLSTCTIFASTKIKKMLEMIVLSVIILLFCIALLCIRVIIKKDGRFPNTHIGGSPAMRKRGIKCAQTQDFEAGVRKNLFERIQQGI